MAEKNNNQVNRGKTFTKKWHREPYPFISPTRPELSAADKNIVVTGGGTGIGKAIAIAFAQAGAKSITILGRRIDCLQSAAAEITSAGSSTAVFYVSVDLSKRSLVDSAFQRVSEKFGPTDILVPNAAKHPKFAAFEGYDEAEFRSSLELNIMATFNVLQAFLPLAAPNAQLLHISSGITRIQPVESMVAYSIVKTAILRMVEYLAAEHPNIYVVHAHPGVVLTDLSREKIAQVPDEPELAGNFVVWLASPEAQFLRNKLVYANWDAEELVSRAEEIRNDAHLLLL